MTQFAKILTAVSVAAMLLAVMLLPAGAAAWLRGDADGDGVITSLDATTVQRVVVGMVDDADGWIARRGCVSGDTLSLMDATCIQRKLALQKDAYQIGQEVSDGATEVPTLHFDFPTEENQLPIIK